MKKIFTLFAALACVMSMSAVTYNVTVPAGTKACYIAGEMNSWSFTEMTKVDDTHYTVTLAEATEAMGYKYCSGPGWAYVEKTEGGEEIGNRVYAVKDVVAKWASVYDPGNAPTPGEAKDITIKAKVPATWTNTITAWVWPTGGEGKEVTPTKEGDWYVYTHHCAELNIIFKNGAGWNGDANQTVDMKFSESTCIEIKSGSGKATYTVIDCEGGENPGDTTVTPEPTIGVTYNVTVPAGTNACYIAGELNGWSHQEMTKVDDTHYTLTVADATTAMKYKYCSGPDWAYVEMQADGVTDVQDRTYAANDVVEAWKAVYDPNGSENPDPTPEPKDIIVKAKMPSHWTETITAWVWETGKEGEVVIPTKDDDWYVVSAHCSALNVIFRNGTVWNGDANQTVNITLMDSACIVLSQSDTTKATYTIVDCETSEPLPEPKGVTYSVTVPAGTNACYIAGEMNNWSHIEMTKVDDTHYTLTVDTATASMKYKYCSGPSWDYVEMQADGVTDVQDRTYAANDVVEAWKAVYDPAGENPDPNPEPKDIIVKAKMPEGWTNTITAWVWATGENGTEVILTREGDWYVYTQNCTELNIIFKNGTGWNGDVNQTVDILLKESTCLQVIAGEGKATYTIVDCETTDIEGVHVSNNVTKFIQDGQLVILFDGVLYNVYGQVVK